MLRWSPKLLEVDWDTLKWVGGLVFVVVSAPVIWFNNRISELEKGKMDVDVFEQFEKRVDGNFGDLKESQKEQNLVLDKIFMKLDGKKDKKASI